MIRLMCCLSLLPALLLCGCKVGGQSMVSKTMYEAQSMRADSCEKDLQETKEHVERLQKQLAEQEAEFRRREEQYARTEKRLRDETKTMRRMQKIRDEVFISLDSSSRMPDLMTKEPLLLKEALNTARTRLGKYSDIYARTLTGTVPGWGVNTARDRYFQARFQYFSTLYFLLLRDQIALNWEELQGMLERLP